MADQASPFDRTRNVAALPIVLLLQVAKRIGLGKQIVSFAFKQMLSPKKKRAAFAGYEPSEHDVFVTTFGKSGTNWMMQIAQQIAHRGAAEFGHIHDDIPWPDAPGVPLGDLSDQSAIARSPTGLRVIKTHLEPEFVPYAEHAKYLTVLRDPKEVVVSSYYFLGGIFGVLDHVSFDQWFDLVTRPNTLVDGWAQHAAGFWDWRDRPNVLVLNYGRVIKEPVASIEEVARVMGVELTPSQLDKVVERSSFSYMKAHESQFAPPVLPFTKPGQRAQMVRRGKAGSSDELMSLAQQQEIDRLCQAELQRLGSSYPYATEFDLATG